MPKYEVKLQVTRELDKIFTVYAADNAEAEEKAVEIVLAWDGIVDAQATHSEEVES
jgi:hypothetical protein